MKGRIIKQVSKLRGLPPGTLVHVGERKTENIKITLIDYDESVFNEKIIANIEQCLPFKDTDTVTWINIDGLHDVETIEKIGRYFDLHPLIMEDIVNTTQRPRYEDAGNYIFVLLKMLYLNSRKKNEVIAEQVSLILGKNFVITFQEQEGDVFNSVRERLKKSKGKVRKMGADFLAYALIDAVVDNYFVILEKFGEIIEGIEAVVVDKPTARTLQNINTVKQEMIFLRKSVWPLREVINGVQRSESQLIKKTTDIYMKDLYDHIIQVIDTVETFRDLVSGIVDTYLSSISNRMNEVMKVLTIIATIFIPITFIAGIYGMNFNPEVSGWNMPELNWAYGYPFALGVMAVIAVGMIIYFKIKRWL